MLSLLWIGVVDQSEADWAMVERRPDEYYWIAVASLPQDSEEGDRVICLRRAQNAKLEWRCHQLPNRILNPFSDAH